MTTTQNWKAHDVDDLLARATDVMAAPSVRRGRISASEAAHALAGIASYIQRTSSLEAMQAACAALARHDDAWATSLRTLPSSNGTVDQAVLLLAVVCRGLMEIAGTENVRAALAFWATETDPAVWQRLFA